MRPARLPPPAPSPPSPPRPARLGGAGPAGYAPDMLVTVLTWAYARQVTSSRRIEELCRTDVAFKVISAGTPPDHVTFPDTGLWLAGSGTPGVTSVLNVTFNHT